MSVIKKPCEAEPNRVLQADYNKKPPLGNEPERGASPHYNTKAPEGAVCVSGNDVVATRSNYKTKALKRANAPEQRVCTLNYTGSTT